jgi:translation elongation factor EF-Tu-like GTPase
MAELRVVGKVIHYWTRLGVAGVELSDTLKMDDWIHVLGVTTDLQQRVTSLQLNRRFISAGHAGQQVGLLVADRVRPGDTVYLIEE